MELGIGWYIGLGSGLIIIVAALGFALWYFSNRVIRISVWDPERIIAFETGTGVWDPEYLPGLPKEEVELQSPYGYKLRGWFIPAPVRTNKTVILVHGITRSRLTSVKYIELFRKRGCHVFVYDHRRHGESGGTSTTYGYYEKYDLKACVDWVAARTGPNPLIGLHGESMGAATVLQYAAIDNRAAFYIADCPYSDVAGQLGHRLKEEYKGLPSFPVIPLVGLICRLRAGFRFKDVSSIEAIRHVETPILFIHGEADDYVPTQMSLNMHRVKPGKKALYLVLEAAHAEAYLKNPDGYDRTVGEFLEEIGFV
jgi:uncharacterized protein